MANNNVTPSVIPNRLKNTSVEHPYVAGAEDIYDDEKGKSQAKVNKDIDATLALHQSEINALDSQNYVTVDTFAELPATGSLDTVYRVANYDGTQVVTNKYAEYAWTGNQYKLLDVKEFGIDDEPKVGSSNPVKSGGVAIHGSAFDVSEYNKNGSTLATYATLADALAAIPVDYWKGGMSVKFVQSSDNKYVQYRLIADEWSTNTEDWSFCGNDVYVENPEFVRVVTDKDDKVLYGVQTDGNFYFGAGCPQQVKDYIQEKLDAIIGTDDVTKKIDTINEMIAFFDQISHDENLKHLLDSLDAKITAEKERAETAEQALDENKVDKEEGKSLIDAEYANGVHYIENPEFVEVKLDQDDRILEAVMLDGTKLLPAGVKVNGTVEHDGATIKVIENPEFTIVWLDSADHILFGIQNDGNFLFGCGVPNQIKEYIEQKIEELGLDEYEDIVTFIGEYLGNTTLEELLSKKVDGEYVENPEWLEVKTDSEDKILEGTTVEGTKVFGADVKVLGALDINGVSYKVVSNPEWLKVVVDTEDRIICGIKANGRFVVYIADFLDDIKAIKTRLEELDIFSTVESSEYIEVKTDGEDKVLEGTRTDGTKVIGGNLEIGGNVTFKNGIPQEIKDYIDSAAMGGSGVSSIEYNEATGDLYATYNDETGVTDVYMDEATGDIYAEIETN